MKAAALLLTPHSQRYLLGNHLEETPVSIAGIIVHALPLPHSSGFAHCIGDCCRLGSLGFRQAGLRQDRDLRAEHDRKSQAQLRNFSTFEVAKGNILILYLLLLTLDSPAKYAEHRADRPVPGPEYHRAEAVRRNES